MQRIVLVQAPASDSSVDLRYIEPLFGFGAPAAAREWLAPVVPGRQLALFAVAWFAHAVAREGLAAYLEASTESCLDELGDGLRLIDEPELADAIDMLAGFAWLPTGVLDAVDRQVPPDLYERVLAHARRHACELVPLDGPLALVPVAATDWN
jgi:hypothetical protein